MRKFLKDQGALIAAVIFYLGVYGYAQTQDEHSNWRFAKEATGSYYAGK